MKVKRALCLVLSLVLAVSLFAGIAPAAQANDLIGDLLSRYFFQKDYLDSLFDESNLVKQGTCGINDGANVWYQIYEIDGATLTETQYFQTINQYADLGFLQLDSNEVYYGVKFFGSGQMENYNRLGQSAPWCDKVTLNLGPYKNSPIEVDMDKKLVVAYVEGERVLENGKKFTGVTNVGQCAFFGQDMLSAVYLGETVSRIEDRAFESTEMLAAINMPSAMEYLGKRAFYGCDKLTFWRAGNTKITEIGERAFYGNSLLISVQFPSRLETIGKMAFAWCRLLGDENFSLPSSLKVIGDGAFMFCNHIGRANELNIPTNVTTIGNYAFLCCGGIGEGDNDGLSFSARTGGLLTIGRYAFAGCRMLQHLRLPNCIITIDPGAFAACERLEDVVFGEDITARRVSIDSNAFTSAQGTAVSAIDLVSSFMQNDNDSDFDPTVNYDEGEMATFNDLTKLTPLRNAAFPNLPASAIKAATDIARSFPEDCIVHYPTATYNRAANDTWKGALDAGKTTWKGYETIGDWEGHFHNYEVSGTKAATHTTDGYTTYTCSVCGKSYTETIAKGHDYHEYSRKEATCTEDGDIVYHCDREGCSEPYYVETIPATGHDPNGVRVIKEPTCTEEGLMTGYCTKCSQYINESIPAKGHNTAMMTVVQPTCGQDGYAYGYCVDCHETISKDDPIVIPASSGAHSWDAGRVTKAATCGAEGVRTYTCSVCGETKTEAIPATGNHRWDNGVVTKQPTTTETGIRTYTCTVCGETRTEDIPVQAHTTHSWDAGVVTTAPKAARTGVRTYTCSVCGETKTEVIPAIFVDVKADSWYETPVDWALENNVTNGTDATHFSPGSDCTRAQMVTFLWRAVGSPTPSRRVSPFTDVQNPNAYYYDAVLWAVENNITAGTTPTTFSPNDKVTRAQTVTFLWRMEGNPVVSARNPFVDVPASQYYYQAVLWAVANGITDGMDATHFAPKNNCTRAQIVTFLQRDLA